MQRLTAVLAAVAWMAGCGPAGKTGPEDLALDVGTEVGFDSRGPDVVVFPDKVAPEEQWEVGGDGLSDVDVFEAGGPGCEPGEGCFRDKCTENKQCRSAFCVDDKGEGVCSQVCMDECPAGWSCKQVAGTYPDVVFICVSLFANLCRPCSSSADCKSIGGAEDVCVDFGADGDFCGGHCTGDGECPSGFSCKDVVTTEGGATKQCIPDSGECACTAKAVLLSAATTCEVVNDEGTCHGKRICAEAGLLPCDAPVPAMETCDGADNDCDGDADEPSLVGGAYLNLCDDGNECTVDVCKGAAGCQNAATAGGICSDGDPCTQGDQCEEGVCKGAPKDCDDGNPCTDDGCGELGCSHEANLDACDDGNACTLGDQCLDGVCEPGTALECGDDDPCTSDLCDAVSGCKNEPIVGCSDTIVDADFWLPCAVSDENDGVVWAMMGSPFDGGEESVGDVSVGLGFAWIGSLSGL